jgi:hypothetical protein
MAALAFAALAKRQEISFVLFFLLLFFFTILGVESVSEIKIPTNKFVLISMPRKNKKKAKRKKAKKRSGGYNRGGFRGLQNNPNHRGGDRGGRNNYNNNGGYNNYDIRRGGSGGRGGRRNYHDNNGGRNYDNNNKSVHNSNKTASNTDFDIFQDQLEQLYYLSKPASKSSGETKQDDTQLHFLGAKLIPSATTKEELISTDLGLWTSIFSYLHFNEHERLSVRTLCRLFHTVLPGPTCAGVYTMYPHPNHASLNSLMTRLNEMARVEGSNVPTHLFLANGVHVIEDEDHDFTGFYGSVVNMLNINIPISIIGESREQCIVMGGLWMNGSEEDDVNVSNLTLRDSESHGVYGHLGASMHMDNVSVENSGGNGVHVSGTKRSTMKNCNVSHSERNGLWVVNVGLMTIDGNGTTIHHNCTGGWTGRYGLNAYDSSSIHLASSLTKEMISKNNGGGGNHGGEGKIKTITGKPKDEKK